LHAYTYLVYIHSLQLLSKQLRASNKRLPCIMKWDAVPPFPVCLFMSINFLCTCCNSRFLKVSCTVSAAWLTTTNSCGLHVHSWSSVHLQYLVCEGLKWLNTIHIQAIMYFIIYHPYAHRSNDIPSTTN